MKAIPPFLCLGMCVSCGAEAFDLPAFNATGSNEITAVSSRASDDYVRIKRADGAYQNETYVFGKGGNYRGPDSDPTIEQKSFEDVAHTIAIPLASQNYLPSNDPNDTKFLIMVYWGTSWGTTGAVTQTLVDMDVKRDAMMLGYAEDLRASIGLDRSPLGWRRRELMGEIQGTRYFVVLMAYDFQLMRKQKRHKLVWDARFSLSENGHDFGKVLPVMAKFASQYFGQNTHGLIRTRVPEGRVDIGEVKSLGEVPEKPNTDTEQPPAKP
jgi:hypothetical protein